MKKAFSLVLALSLLVLSTANAAPKSSINRGGFGFLYADTNHFDNPGLFSQLRGFAAGGEFLKDKDNNNVGLTSSMIGGNGRVGGGLFVDRTGFELTDPAASTDSAGGGFGFNFAKNMAMVGVGYSRSIDASPSSDGTVFATITYQPVGKGFSIGGGAFTTINADTDVKSAIAGVGYAFNPMVQVEANWLARDLTDPGYWTASGYLNLTGKFAYLTGGFEFQKINTASVKTGMLRLGFVIGNVIDISGYGTKMIETGSEFNYGGTFRLRL